MRPDSSRSRRLAVFGLLASLMLGGCGAGGASSEPPGGTLKQDMGPHGGAAVPLGDRGYVEVVMDAGGGRPGQSRLVAYFLSTDRKSPLAATPASVTASLQLPTGESPSVAFTADGKTGENRFASPPGDYAFDELRGEVTAALDGETFTVPFAFR